MSQGPISLTSQWFVRLGLEEQVLEAVSLLADAVEAGEPGTLMYLVHVPYRGPALQSLPPDDPSSLLFVEEYRDVQAFLQHVNGPLFTQFVRDHGHLFVQANDRPYTTVEFLVRRAGFVRAAGIRPPRELGPPANRHPAVMFEIIAKDQARAQAFYAQVFGWSYELGTGRFAYVHFPLQARPLLGGIGQANPGVPGFEPGHSFYLLVSSLETTIAAAQAAGGRLHAPIASVDGYRFAMIQDPEGNPIGLIEPFTAHDTNDACRHRDVK